MQKTFDLSILTPENDFFKEEVAQVIVSTPEGEMGIMADHMPVIAVVVKSILKLEKGGIWSHASIGQGVFISSATGIEFFVETAEWVEAS